MRTKLAAIVTGAVVFTGLGVGTATTASASTPAVCSWSGFSSDNEPEVSYGDSGPEIKALQCELNYSVRGAGLQEDGIFGDQTLSIVKKFQGCAVSRSTASSARRPGPRWTTRATSTPRRLTSADPPSADPTRPSTPHHLYRRKNHA
ncbi:peptidoglycan-binding protein [Kitasatospora sp. NPDC017646]|uniref:peptidoglycan-binding protein n=1 Tax=Kitasatospora sp. NPDC017646 TaxID=3364024 RepID=UPI00378F9095